MKKDIFQDSLTIPIIILICCIGAGFLGLSAVSIYRNLNNHVHAAIIKSKTQAQLVGENTSSMISTVDFALLSFCSMAGNESENQAVSPAVFAFIKKEIAYLPQLQNMLFFNAKGEMAWYIHEPGDITLESFEQYRQAWLEFSIETIFLDEKKPLILLSRRVENQNNEFIGVMAAVIDPYVFYNRYDDYLKLDASGVALLDDKGRMLADWGTRPDVKQQILPRQSRPASDFTREAADTTIAGGSRTVEDKNWVISTYQLRGFPYHVAVMHTKKEVLEKWRKETIRDVFIIAITFIIALVTIALAFWQAKKRKEAEFSLTQHQLNLEKTIQQRTEQLHLTNTTLVEKNQALENALAQIKTLSGLLPICMHCKKIR
ncbi:MAG: hypothetical protein LC660_06725, partial [Desulfobacteraceae bacterium]|nr:hypothetical protein [Desulfobacteraceae bacterium]